MTRAVERAVAGVRGEVAAAVRATLPDATVEETSEGVTVSGRGVVRRWVDDARLRHLSGWLR